ncbi:MFS transporter [Actinoplanes sp. NPDC026619]|uniref:MFS transporter n=1 Tax=Actinoplanes sp. NPDC026619 TaxID=3155798 RepID=UPI0033FD1E33
MTLLDRVHSGPFIAFPRWWSRPPVVAGVLAGVLSLVWALWLAHDAGDLAAQYAWTGFVRHHPGSAYNLSWYGGIHPANYSVLSPYLMAWIGVRTTGVLACIGCASLGALALTRFGIRRPMLPSLWLAVAVWSNLSAGRVTYLLGMVFALMVVLLAPPGTARQRHRPLIAAGLGVVATLCSPVAGLFIEVLAAALFLVGRRRRAYLLAAGPPVVISATSLLFPFSGVQPFPWFSALLTVGSAAAVGLLTPPAWRTVRACAWVYAVGVALCWALPTPIGSNVERLALLASAAVLFCAAPLAGPRRWRTVLTYAVATGLAAWTLVQPVADLVHKEPVPATATADARPLIDELVRLGAQNGRVEVVPLRTHWEASAVAPYVGLARGWNRQADVERNPLFYDGTLTADTYRAWLNTWGVAYVVLPAMEPDSSGVAEAKLITAGETWLPLVWSDASWRIYRVEESVPLVSAPAEVVSSGPAALTVRMPRAGTALLRIAWSPWLAIADVDNDDDTNPRACLSQSGSWTELFAPAAGTYTIEARYTLDRGSPCAVDPSAEPPTGRHRGLLDTGLRRMLTERNPG